MAGDRQWEWGRLLKLGQRLLGDQAYAGPEPDECCAVGPHGHDGPHIRRIEPASWQPMTPERFRDMAEKGFGPPIHHTSIAQDRKPEKKPR